jgi:ABC-type polysaccharide transport system permease subunit
MLHYYYFPIGIIISTLLLTLLPQISFLPIFPFALLLIYTAAYRPFKTIRENIRACFNYIVIILLFGLRAYIQYFPFGQLNKNTTNTFVYHFINIILILFVAIIALATIIYDLIYKYYIDPRR